MSHQKTIDELEATRKRNNSNWMDLVRLAFECDPVRAKKIMKNICDMDAKIMKVARKLAK